MIRVGLARIEQHKGVVPLKQHHPNVQYFEAQLVDPDELEWIADIVGPDPMTDREPPKLMRRFILAPPLETRSFPYKRTWRRVRCERHGVWEPIELGACEPLVVQ